jgi:hypothetical protein
MDRKPPMTLRQVTLRQDHVSGGAFVIAGIIVFLLSGDLPLGSMAMPGAGMMPKLVLVLMISFGLALIAQAHKSPPLTELEWDDLPHALCVMTATAAATALYNALGFRITMALMLCALVVVVERQNMLRALLFGIGVPIIADVLFGYFLKSPLPRGLIGF